MAEKAILQIKEAEAQAQALIKNAQEQAARIVKCAEEETADAFSAFSEACKREAAEKKGQAETAALASGAAFAKETEVLCAELKQKLSSNREKAVGAVIQSVMA